MCFDNHHLFQCILPRHQFFWAKSLSHGSQRELCHRYPCWKDLILTMFKSNQMDAKWKEMNAFTPWSSKDMEKAYKSGIFILKLSQADRKSIALYNLARRLFKTFTGHLGVQTIVCPPVQRVRFCSRGMACPSDSKILFPGAHLC